nr:hypothetical protein CFP56_00187 [Quercus suber]
MWLGASGSSTGLELLLVAAIFATLPRGLAARERCLDQSGIYRHYQTPAPKQQKTSGDRCFDVLRNSRGTAPATSSVIW